MTTAQEPGDQWEQTASALRAYRDAQREAWGGLDDVVLARYLAGEASEEERQSVERAAADRPHVREALAILREVLDLEPGGKELTPCRDSAQKGQLPLLSVAPTSPGPASPRPGSSPSRGRRWLAWTRGLELPLSLAASLLLLLGAVPWLTTTRGAGALDQPPPPVTAAAPDDRVQLSYPGPPKVAHQGTTDKEPAKAGPAAISLGGRPDERPTPPPEPKPPDGPPRVVVATPGPRSSGPPVPAGTLVASAHWGYSARPYWGSADLIRSQGESLVRDQEAEMIREEVRQEQLKTRKARYEQWQWEIKFLAAADLLVRDLRKQKELVAAIDASDERIYSGAALNDLVQVLFDNKYKLSASGSVMIPLGLLDHMSFTTADEKDRPTGLMKRDRIDWPPLLKQQAFEDLRETADRQYLQLRKTAQATKEVDPRGVLELQATLQSLALLCSQMSRDGALPGYATGHDFINATRMIRELQSVLGVIKRDPRAAGIVAVKADTVFDLLTQMRSWDNGRLLFAPALEGEEKYYSRLHALLLEEARRLGIVPKTPA